MDFILERHSFTRDGIFSTLKSVGGTQAFSCLEHAYPSLIQDNGFVPKVVEGVYVCTRHAPNRLPYETFELQSVPNFLGDPVTGILIHVGNFNNDSNGCILIGTEYQNNVEAGPMIIGSRVAFHRFMAIQDGVQSFTLTIKRA